MDRGKSVLRFGFAGGIAYILFGFHGRMYFFGWSGLGFTYRFGAPVSSRGRFGMESIFSLRRLPRRHPILDFVRMKRGAKTFPLFCRRDWLYGSINFSRHGLISCFVAERVVLDDGEVLLVNSDDVEKIQSRSLEADCEVVDKGW